MADLDQLMQPVSADNVAGPDLSYDPRRQEIEGAFEAAKLAESGEGTAPDWPAVTRSIVELSGLSKDAWLAVYLARAGAWNQDLTQVALGCAYLAGMFETWWDAVHPSLADYGYQGRKGACESFVGFGEFLRPLKHVTLVSHHRFGQFNGEQIEQFAKDEAAENIGLFRAAVADTEPADISKAVDLLQEIRTSIGRIDAVMTAKAEGDTGTNFATTYETLDSMRNALVTLTGVAEPVASPDAQAQTAGDSDVGGAPTASLAIDSRAAVIRAMESIISYYSRHEPGSPIPLVLARAKGWVDMDFLSILNDINPGAAGEAKRVLSRAEPEEEIKSD